LRIGGKGVTGTDTSERIQGHVDLHTGTRTLREGLDIHAPNLALVEYVRLKTHAALCAADGVERSRVEIRAVGEDVQFPRSIELGINERLQDREELLRVIGGHFLTAVDAIFRRGADETAEQVGSHYNGCDASEHKNARGYDNGQIS
jgi:hypothetical protein